MNARRVANFLSLFFTAGAGSAGAVPDDRLFADSFGAECGNNAIEIPETCDGNCPVCSETLTGFTSSGSANTCDIVCHIPVQTCTGGDNVCPLVAGTSYAQCNAQSDPECLGPSWRYSQFPNVDTTSQACRTVAVYGAQPGASYDITTCAPDVTQAGSGDTNITSVMDNLGNSYPVANDDCSDTAALPRLAGWTCVNNLGFQRMSCASASPGGFRIPAGVNRIYVSICRFDDAGGGVSPVFIWYNGTVLPNPG